MSPKIPTSSVALRAAAVAAAALAVGRYNRLDALGLLAVLYFTGFLAGAWGKRQGWLAGLIVGMPLSLYQVSRMASSEMGGARAVLHSPDYWRVAVPAALVAGAMAILGSMTGAWLRDMKLQRQ